MQYCDGHHGAVTALEFSTADQALLSAGKDGVVSRCNPPDPEEICRVDEPIRTMAVSPNGHWLAIGTETGNLLLWDLVENRKAATTQTPGHSISSVAFFPKSETVAFAMDGDEERAVAGPPGVRFWDWERNRIRMLPDDRAARFFVRAMTVNRDKRLIAWVTDLRALTVWRALRDEPVRFNLSNSCRALALSRDGLLLAAAIGWNVHLFDLEQRCERRILNGHKGIVTSLTFGPEDRTLMSTSWDRSVKWWDPSTGHERASFDWSIARGTASAFSPDGMRAAAADENGTIVLWDIDA